MKKVLCVLLAIVIVLAGAAFGAYKYAEYKSSNAFIDDAVYPLDSKELDLRGQEISFDHFNAAQAALPNCRILWDVPFQGGKYPSDSESLTVPSLTEDEIHVLVNYFPNLKTLDASECDQYDVLAMAEVSLPECQVVYQVSLGETSADPHAAELVLEADQYDFDTLMANLAYLTELKSLTLKMPTISQDQINELKAAYEGVEIKCTVELLGAEYDQLTESLDLSAMTSDDVAGVAEKLAMLPNLTSIELMDADGKTNLSVEDVKALKQAAPNAAIHYVFDFYGVSISTTDKEVKIYGKKIGDDGADNVRAALDLMENCKRFVLEYCSISNDVMAQLRDEYRDKTKVVWRVNFGGGSTLTDVEVIRSTYDLVDDNCENLKYCEDVRFMDIGHNEFLDGVPFVAHMPKLEGIIVSGAPLKSLEPFENCKNLKFLEIAFCEYITDLTPLAGCESLQMLNISNTHAVDLTPLDNLPLTHLCARTNPTGKSRVSQEEQQRFTEQHPDCWISFSGAQPYGVGWRYDEDEITPLPYYAMLRRVFRYDAAAVPNNAGWYLEEGITDLDYVEE